MSWRHKGIEINVTSNGIFKAHVDDLEVIADSRANCEKKIDEAVKRGARRFLDLPVIGVLSSSSHYGSVKDSREGEIFQATLTGVNRTTRYLQVEGTPKGFNLENVLADTSENRVLLETRKRLNDELAAVNHTLGFLWLKPSGYGRIEAGEYDKVLKKIEEIHSRSVAAKV